MITKFYEITCDYCGSAIYHGLGSAKSTLQVALNLKEPIIVYKGRHFCDEHCKEHWLQNGKVNVMGEKT